jgi:hypothetical protein
MFIAYRIRNTKQILKPEPNTLFSNTDGSKKGKQIAITTVRQMDDINTTSV